MSAAKPKRSPFAIARFLFLFLTLLVWVVVIAAALELYQVLRWRAIEKSNPYYLARHGVIPWPGSQAGEQIITAAGIRWIEDPLGAREENDDIAPPSVRLPQPDPRDELAARIRFFLALNKEDRGVMANLHGLEIYLVNLGREITAQFPMALGDDAPVPMNTIFREGILEAFREKVQEVLDTGAPVFARITHAVDAPGFVDDAFFPIPDSDGAIAGVVIVINVNPAMARAEDPDYIWESEYFTYKKHASLPGRNVHTNNFGWRGDDVAVPKPTGVFRVICVGGSTTEEGFTSDTTYPGFLRQKLAAEFGEERVDVINCGIPGLNALKEKMRLPDYLFLEPDMAVYYNGVNDICHRLIPEWNAQPGFAKMLLRKSRFFVHHFGRWLLPPDDVIAADIDQKVLAHIRFMQRWFAEHNVPMAVCSFAGPDWSLLSREERDYYSYYHQLEWGGRYSSFRAYCPVLNIFNERVRAMCKELGVTYIPVAERIRGGAQYFGDICHMRNPGIEQKAEAVFLAIRAAVAEKLAAMPPPASVGGLAEHQVAAHEEVEGQARKDAEYSRDLRDALERRP